MLSGIGVSGGGGIGSGTWNFSGGSAVTVAGSSIDVYAGATKVAEISGNGVIRALGFEQVLSW